jgi:hypothetical protein
MSMIRHSVCFLGALGLAFSAAWCLVADEPGGQATQSDRELHVVSVYEGVTKTGGQIHGGRAVVEVDRPGKQVTLALSSYDPVTWEVKAGPGSAVEKVILGGSRAAVKGLPENVTIVEAFGEGGKLPYGGYEIDSERFRQMVAALAKMSELPIASFTARYRYEHGAPLVVNQVLSDPRLASDFPKPASAGSLPKLRFAAMHYLAGNRPHESVISYGEYTLDGPDLASLRPVPPGVSRVAHDPEGRKYYGIASHGVVEIDADFKSASELDMGLEVPRLSWPSDITFDSKRRRVMMTSSGGGGYLYAFDVAKRQWSALIEKHGVECVTYHPQRDAMFGIGLAFGRENAKPDLCRLDAEGKMVSRQPITGIPAGSLSGGPGVCGIQLAPAERHLVLISSPHGVRPRSGNVPTYIYLIDLDTAQATLTWKSGATPKESETVARQPVEPAAVNAATAEVHLVGLYEGQERTRSASVTVKRPGKRVTLVLTSYETVTWQVSVDPETVLEKVILGGYERQAVKGLSDGVPVVEAFRGGGAARSLGYCYRIDSLAFRQVMDNLASLVDAPVASFQGAYRPTGVLMVDRLQSDARLAYDYPQPASQAELPKLQFKAFHREPGGNNFDSQTSYGDFTLAGPVSESLKPVPGRVGRIAHDPATGKHYGIANHDVVEVDWQANLTTKMDLGLDVPNLSWPSDVTFDSRRQRLLLKSSGGGGYLYAYSPAKQTWSVVMEKPGVDLIAWHPNQDALFGISLPHSEEGSRPVLVRFNQYGAVIRQTPLIGPIVPGSVGGGPGIPTAQLIAIDRYLVLLTSSDPRSSGGGRNLLYLVDPETAQATLTWRQTVSAER